MLTSHPIFAAIAVGCLLACTYMLIRVLSGSDRQSWHRHLDKTSLVAGILMISVGLVQYYIARQNERLHRVHYYKSAPVTPTQDYLAAFGFTALGFATGII